MPTKLSSFRTSEKFENIDAHPRVEVIKNPPEWKYIEELLGPKTIPAPVPKEEYPSGWQPQDPAKYKKLPYYIRRSRSHMLPIYLHTKYQGMRRLTIIRHIEGDIWRAQKDFEAFIKTRIGNNPVYVYVNEMNGQIKIKGDYVTLLRKFFYSNGL